MQSETITTNVVSSNPAQARWYQVCQWLAAGQWFSLVSYTNKTDHHDITEILYDPPTLTGDGQCISKYVVGVMLS
jgi:hypothetical protein